LIRSWSTATLLVKNGAFSPGEITALREFCRSRSFDVAYYPGVQPTEVNRYNILERPEFHDGALALLGPERDAFLERYKFNVAPATDDRPYFFQFFKWRTLPELLALKQRGGLPLLEWGYPVVAATLIQAALASVVLILLPLWAARGRSDTGDAPAWSRARVVGYFAAIGFAFMFVEIAFIQKFVLFLAHPLYAVAVVLCAFLTFAGLGSRASRRFSATRPSSARAVAWIAVAIGLLAVSYTLILPGLFRPLMSLPDAAKIPLSIALVAPLAFAMGMPFPLGLASLARHSRALVPWAWGINASISVVAAILATLLAIHLGFRVLVVLAVVLYAAAAVAYRPRSLPSAS